MRERGARLQVVAKRHVDRASAGSAQKAQGRAGVGRAPGAQQCDQGRAPPPRPALCGPPSWAGTSLHKTATAFGNNAQDRTR